MNPIQAFFPVQITPVPMMPPTAALALVLHVIDQEPTFIPFAARTIMGPEYVSRVAMPVLQVVRK